MAHPMTSMATATPTAQLAPSGPVATCPGQLRVAARATAKPAPVPMITAAPASTAPSSPAAAVSAAREAPTARRSAISRSRPAARAPSSVSTVSAATPPAAPAVRARTSNSSPMAACCVAAGVRAPSAKPSEGRCVVVAYSRREAVPVWIERSIVVTGSIAARATAPPRR